MDHSSSRWGRPRDDIYGPYDHSFVQSNINFEPHSNEHSLTSTNPHMRTLQPTVTGSSVIGMKFQDGVIIAADNLASYGSLRRFVNMQRILKVGSEVVVGFGGDVSDFQAISDMLEELEVEQSYDNPVTELKAPNIHSYLQRVMYNRRSKMDPLWNSVLVGGFKDNEPYLAYIDLLGVTYQSPTLATGFGNYLAIPILRKLADKEDDVKNVTKEQAKGAINEAMKVLWYRDGRAMDKFTMAIVTKSGVEFEDVHIKDQNWEMAKQIKGFGTQKE